MQIYKIPNSCGQFFHNNFHFFRHILSCTAKTSKHLVKKNIGQYNHTLCPGFAQQNIFDKLNRFLRHHQIQVQKWWNSAFSHHYQGRVDFDTVNLFHFAGMDLAYILASRGGLTNPFPRGKIGQSFPCRGLGNHPRAMNTQLVIQCSWGIEKTQAGKQKWWHWLYVE